MKRYSFFLIVLVFTIAYCNTTDENTNNKTTTTTDSLANDTVNLGLCLYKTNPRYWQYKGKPVLLLGATNNDNLYQSADIVQQLDELRDAGGNYIRNTMSARDSGDVWPFKPAENGKYDLDDWNTEYWQRFENLLKLTSARDIIVQIEIWDRFDFSREPWDVNPFNPANNITLSEKNSGLKTTYPKHPFHDEQPFFHSIKGMPLYTKVLDTVRYYQERYVEKLLSYTFQYDNILYCMNNETSTPVAWGQYWIHFIQAKAKKQEKNIFTTDMFDHFFKPQNCKKCKVAFQNPELYQFLDISQINSRNFGQNHWDTLQWIVNQREQYEIRPLNCTKVYGGNNSGWGSGSNDDGVARFCRDILGGCASARHHRPNSGNGLNQKAKASIQAIRTLESAIKLWEATPAMQLLENRDPDEAYITVSWNGNYALFFPKGGEVQLTVENKNINYEQRWIDITTGKWSSKKQMLTGQTKYTIKTSDTIPTFSVLIKK